MPVLSCPKCPTKLKVPDGVSGNTRCPKCGTVFPVPQPQFEVVDEPKKPAAKPAPRPVPPLPPPPSAKPKPEPQFEVVEAKKRVVADDDDEEEEERPRKKKRLDDDDDDDEDDRPRSRKKRRDDDDEEEDDRPRKKKTKKGTGKKKRFRDDDDADSYDNWRRGSAPEFAKAKTGALLIGLSYWMNLAAYGLLALYTLILWLLVAGETSGSSSRGGSRSGSSGGGEGSGEFFEMLVILPGLVGLCSWLVGLVGCSFAIAGPRKARGMAITATVFAAVHLLLVGVTFSNLQDGLSGVGRFAPGVGKVAWIAVASLLPAVDSFLPMLFYQSKAINSDYVIALLAGIAEGGRLIFGLLALKALAAAAKDYDASERSGYGMMIVIGVLGGVVVLTLLVVVLLREGNFKSLNTYLNLGLGTVFLMYLAYALMMLSPALAAFATKDACARKA